MGVMHQILYSDICSPHVRKVIIVGDVVNVLRFIKGNSLLLNYVWTRFLLMNHRVYSVLQIGMRPWILHPLLSALHLVLRLVIVKVYHRPLVRSELGG